jgi:hypothetical protein
MQKVQGGGVPSGNVVNSGTNRNSRMNKRRSRGQRRTQAQLWFQKEKEEALDPTHLNDFGDKLGLKLEGRL